MLKIISSILLFSLVSFAKEVPQLASPIMDMAKVLNNSQELESKIRILYNQGSGPQITILTVPSLEGESIEEYANKVFRIWKLGDAKRDDGVLFLISINDRKMRIEVGQGLEGSLTDLRSKRILGTLKPYFKSQDYSGGVLSGLEQIISEVSKKDAVQSVAPVSSSTNEDSERLFSNLMLSIAFLVFSGMFFRRSLNSYKKHKKELFLMKEDLKEKEESINNIEKKFKMKIQSIIKEVTQSQKHIEDEIQIQNDKIRQLEPEFKKSDYFKMEKQKEELSGLKEIESNMLSMIESNKLVCMKGE